MDYKIFFSRKSPEVAKDILGRLIVRNSQKGSTGARILEVAAYGGGKNIGARTGMKYGPARIFLMPYRGTLLFNIATYQEMHASCIEIRKIGTHAQVIKGAGAISNFFGLTRKLDGALLGREIEILGERMKNNILEVGGGSENCIAIYSLGEP